MADIKLTQEVFERLSKALIGVEKFLAINNNDTWVDEASALALLGCKKTKLFELKASGEVRYKKVGRANQYSRASIDKCIQKYSS